MRRHAGMEIIVGLFVIASILALTVLAFRVAGTQELLGSKTYAISADFDNIGSLRLNSPVTLAGVTIGRVMSITLNRNTLQAHVVMNIQKKIQQLPIDSSASILTQGILGANYIGITPGFATQSLHAGDSIPETHSALILEQVIGQLLFSLKGAPDKK